MRSKTTLSGKDKSIRRKYREKALKLFREGWGYKHVATQLNLSIFTVRDWHRLYRCDSFEPEIRNPGNSPVNVIDEETKEHIRMDYKGGETISSLCLKYGKCKTTIRYIVNYSGQEPEA